MAEWGRWGVGGGRSHGALFVGVVCVIREGEGVVQGEDGPMLCAFVLMLFI